MSANNHFSGFGPNTAKMFGEMMGLKENITFPISDYKPPVDLEDKKYSKFEDWKNKNMRQSEISDFL